MNDIQQKLLQKIKAGEVKMVPRWHFVLRGLLWGAVTVVVAIIAVYLLSFVLYALHQSGLAFAPLFGWMGIMMFIVSSPWLLIGVVGIFLFLLYILVSRYSFSYQKPLVYSIVGLVLFVIAVSSLIQETNLHEKAGEFVERHDIPGLAPMYKEISERPPKDITRGTISEFTDNGFVFATEAGEEYTVTYNERTRFPVDTELAVGDAVMVFGPIQENTIEAFGVRIDDGSEMPPPPPDDKHSSREPGEGDIPPPEEIQ